MALQIHWFPGHMNKALHEIEEKIKMMDVIIEILDARAPNSSINKNLEDLLANKKKLIILSKPDLADPNLTTKWCNKLKETNSFVMPIDLSKGDAIQQIEKGIKILGKDKWEKDRSKGMKPQPLKTMILGIPNVGKSSLINRLAKRKAAGVQNKPGYTRGEQWIKASDNFLLLDTPGVLPMSYDNQEIASNLALIGSIREDILPNSDLVSSLLNYLKQYYPNSLQKRFNVLTIETSECVLKQICLSRKINSSNNDENIKRAETVLLKEFKDGLLGRITLEQI